jgi:hypothetical protein
MTEDREEPHHDFRRLMAPLLRPEQIMSDEAKKEGRDWTADIVPVAVYSLVIFVLLFLYVRYF